jgi:hypothetical protein
MKKSITSHVETLLLDQADIAVENGVGTVEKRAASESAPDLTQRRRLIPKAANSETTFRIQIAGGQIISVDPGSSGTVEGVNVILGQAEAHDDAHGGTGTLASAGIAQTMHAATHNELSRRHDHLRSNKERRIVYM